MVSIAQTMKKYHGRKAETYDEIRTKQGRWHLENAAVEKMLSTCDLSHVLDCPVGTGRFLALYRKIGTKMVTGIDASSSMLSLAGKKTKGGGMFLRLSTGDATATEKQDKEFSTTVCVRFLDLIDEEAMRRVMAEITRVTSHSIVLTIRLGDAYVPKSNTAEHDRAKFNALVKRLGWKIEESIPIMNAGWTVMRLGRK